MAWLRTFSKKFEERFAKFIGTKYAVGVNSGTAALHLSLLCHNFPKGKKVLVPAITFSATAASALYCGLIPKFVDINPKNLTIDFEDLKKKYSKDCVAIICVHMGGHPCEMEKILPEYQYTEYTSATAKLIAQNYAKLRESMGVF